MVLGLSSLGMSFILFADLFKGSGFHREDGRPAVNATRDPN